MTVMCPSEYLQERNYEMSISGERCATKGHEGSPVQIKYKQRNVYTGSENSSDAIALSSAVLPIATLGLRLGSLLCLPLLLAFICFLHHCIQLLRESI